MSRNEPFLVHTANLEKYDPKIFEVKKQYLNPKDAKYEVAAVWKFYNRAEPNYSGGHNLKLELQFKVDRDTEKLHEDVKLPITAGTEVSLLFFDHRPDEIPKMLMLFGLTRKKYSPKTHKILRDGEAATLSSFKYLDSGYEYDGYRIEIQLKYNIPSSRSEKLIKDGKLIYLAIVQDTIQTTVDQFT